MNILEAILYAVAIALASLLVVLIVRLSLLNRRAVYDLAQSEINVAVLLDQLEKAEQQRELEKSEGFIRFISESRDWAFGYIEEAQETIKDFVEKTDSLYKDPAISPAVLISYRKLLALLPEDSKNEN
jgi:hypothetical protein